MKITTDVNPAGIRPGGNVSPRSSTENRSINASDAKLAQDIIAKTQREKSLVDALAIAQSSRDLVQKALTVSSRLMSLASEAMITGRVNTDEVARQMSSINNSMGNYGESVFAPAGHNTYPEEDTKEKFIQNYRQLREKGLVLLSGKPVEKNEFEPITANLKGTVKEMDSKIKNYSAELGKVKITDHQNLNYPRVNKNTAESVINNPAKALVSQGNINYEIAGKLTGA